MTNPSPNVPPKASGKRTLDRVQRQLIVIYGVLLLLGGGYELFIRLTGWSMPCYLHEWTGFYCPGCGLTRMVQALLAGQIALAFRQNGAALLVIAVWLCYSVGRFFGRPRWCRSESVTFWLLMGSVAVMVLFSILRNLPAGWMLRPV